MKKFILLIFFASLSFTGFAQQTYWTTSPSGWNAVTPSFRFKANTPDSLNSLLIFNPLTGRYNEIYTATETNKRYLKPSDSSSYIKNQNTGPQTANAWVSGTFKIGNKWVFAPTSPYAQLNWTGTHNGTIDSKGDTLTFGTFDASGAFTSFRVGVFSGSSVRGDGRYWQFNLNGSGRGNALIDGNVSTLLNGIGIRHHELAQSTNGHQINTQIFTDSKQAGSASRTSLDIVDKNDTTFTVPDTAITIRQGNALNAAILHNGMFYTPGILPGTATVGIGRDAGGNLVTTSGAPVSDTTALARKTTTITGANGLTGGGNLSANRVISNDTYITTYGGNPDGVTDNTAALVSLKAAIGTKRFIYFPQNTAGTAKYYFHGQPDFTGYSLAADRNVVISDSATAIATSYGASSWLTPVKIFNRDLRDTLLIKPNIHLPDYTSAIGSIDKTMGFTNLKRVINTAVTMSYYNSTSDVKTTGVGFSPTDDWRKQINTATIVASAAPDSLTFDVADQPARLGKIYVSSVTEAVNATNAAAVAIVYSGAEWIVFRVEADHYMFGSKKTSVAFADTAFKRGTLHQYYFNQNDIPQLSVRVVGLNKVEFYVNGVLIKTAGLLGNVQSIGFGVNRIANAGGLNNIEGIQSADMQRRNSGNTLNILASGDSQNLPHLATLAPADYLKKFLTINGGIPSVTVTNIAVSGTKLGAQWAIIKTMSAAQLAAYDYVFLITGANDNNSSLSLAAATLTTFKKTIDSLSAYVAAAGHVKLIITESPMSSDTTQTHYGYPSANTGRASQFRQLLQTSAADFSATTIYCESTNFSGEMVLSLQLIDNLHEQTLYNATLAAPAAIAILNDRQNYIPILPSSFRQGNNIVGQSAAVPTTGNWNVGDIVYNTTVTAGGIYGWANTIAGSPGTFSPVYTDPSTTTGDLVYNSTATTKARLAIGGANTLLHGGASAPSYSAVATGDISANAVTYAKLQAGTTNRFISTGTGTAYSETSIVNGLDIIPTWGASSLTLTADTATATTGLVAKNRLTAALALYARTNAINFTGIPQVNGVALTANQAIGVNGAGTSPIAITPFINTAQNTVTGSLQILSAAAPEWRFNRTSTGSGSAIASFYTNNVAKFQTGLNSGVNDNWSVYNNGLSADAIAVAAGTNAITLGGTLTLKAYTVSTLPTPATGTIAYVTDALTPASLAIVVGGGTSVVPVFYNGTNWIVQ